MSDSEILTEVRLTVARVEQRQLHILELMEDHKTKMDRIEQEAATMKGRVWLVSTIVFGTFAAIWEIIKSRIVGN